MSDIEKRKLQHINLSLDPASQGLSDPFADVSLPYRALPELDLNEVDTATTLLGKHLSQPLIIASMTGGSEHARTINTNLAIAAEEAKVALGVGSQRIALVKEDAAETFKLVRKYAPKTVLFANMGAVQLNYGYSVEQYKQVVDLIEADALYLHLNPLQEAIQPEGDTNFKGLTEKIANLVKEIGVPVFIKEVGHGLDPETCKTLITIGVAGIDIAGTGGTSWAWIEAQRADNEQFAEWFKGYGISADLALQDLKGIDLAGTNIVVSGGIRSPLQGLKAHMLGADYYSAAYPFLKPALESPEALIQLIQTWQKGLQIGMFVGGIASWKHDFPSSLIQ
jgi:isopentenyl-diphosphate delta-isomerase